VKFGDADACGIGPTARFSFRLDLPSRALTFAGATPDAATRAAIAARFSALAGDKPTRPTIGMLVDTVGGVPRAIAYGFARGTDSVPRAVYGVESDPSALVTHLRTIAAKHALLPPSLVRGRPLDSLLVLQVRRADGGLLTTVGSAMPRDERLSAEETTSALAGSLVSRVVLRPEAASTLLIGGVPGSRLNTLLLLLASSAVLAGIALLQLRRGRELARLRSRFVANVSHELRTPLAQISMFSETLLLQRERSREERQEFLSIIFREARRLSHLVDSVLRFSRTEAGGTERALRLERTDIGAEVTLAARAFAPLAMAAGVTLRTTLEPDVEAPAETDALRQVLLNLLDNAVKFGPKGQTVTLGVACEGIEARITVDDEGPGIPASQRLSVFEPFAQVALHQSRTTTGAGIGLAVVADLVRAHGGRVWIADAPGGRGTRVTVALPAMGAPAPRDTAPVFDETGAVLAAR
jgi:signal transduction histidine kinase